MDARRYHHSRRLAHLLSAPFIYGVMIPAVIWDIGIEIYHRVCFPLYELRYVSRRRYIKIDRHRLKYLSGIEKLNCAYCGYVNGLLAYSVEIVARTERYWCGIQHAKVRGFQPPAHHRDFVPYNNREALTQRFPKDGATR